MNKRLLQLEVHFAPDGSEATIQWFDTDTEDTETIAVLRGSIEGVTWEPVKALINTWYQDYHVQIWDWDNEDWVDLNDPKED